MKTSKIVWLSIGGLVVLCALSMGLSLAFGWFGVGYTATVGKAQQNASRKVFEQSQSRVDAMNEELSRYKLQYSQATTAADSEAIREVILQDFASFDENQITSASLRSFLLSIENN